MKPEVKNVILASEDQVAIDAVSAKLMGFDPMSIKYINLAHTRGWVSATRARSSWSATMFSNENWHFHVGHSLHQFMGWLTWFGPTKFLQKLITRTFLVNIPIAFSETYHDLYHWPLVEKKLYEEWCENTGWGQMFVRYKKEGFLNKE